MGNKKARRRCRREQKKLDCERYFDLFVLRSPIIDMSAQRLSFTLAMRKIFCQSIGDGTVLCGQIDATEDKYAANSLGDEKLFVKKQHPADDADQRHDVHKYGCLTGSDDAGTFVPKDHGDQPAGKNDE